MKLLAFDTSTRALNVALLEGDPAAGEFTVRASHTSLGRRQHGETLAPAVDTLIKQLDWRTADIEGMIVGTGPGSYTGLRIGVTFAKVWAHTKQLPLFAVSSLALMAAGSDKRGFVVPVMDARRQTAYTGFYQWNQGKLSLQLEDRHIAFAEWLEEVSAVLDQHPEQPVTLVGTDIDEFVGLFQERFPEKELTVVTDWQAYPHIENALGRVPVEAVADASLLVPNYAHATLAEREWAERAQASGEDIESYRDPDQLIEHQQS